MSVCFRESTVFKSFLFYQWPEKSIKHKANVSWLVKGIDNSVNRRIARQDDLGVSGKVKQPKDLIHGSHVHSPSFFRSWPFSIR